MEIETLKTLIPAIPGMITSGLAVWNDIVKPLLKKVGYNISKEQEQEMLLLEEKKDIDAFVKKIEEINKEIVQTVIYQNQSGNNSVQANNNSGTIDNSQKFYFGIEEKQTEVKKN